MRRKLNDLNLTDNFLFGSVVSYPEMGEEFVRTFLMIVFRKDFGRLTSKCG
ncbi:MAG: hypothetical protein LUH07_05445 [Lachnospiraceae bacterium]|nr:hypothetical protein [Lachnospiraceae bacterium]